MIFSFDMTKKKEAFCGASIRGKGHIQSHVENQDSFIVKKLQCGTIVCVADGVGSHKYSKCGSKAAVNAVYQSFSLFEKGEIPVTNITKNIFSLFKCAIPECKRQQASTTCAFAYVSMQHGLFLGQVGDGVCLFSINGTFRELLEKDDDFANLVVAMNPSKESVKWKTRHFNISNQDEIKILIATDGVSNDIIPERKKDCLEYYTNRYMHTCHLVRNARVRLDLLNWNVPGSIDDKTMAIFSRG